MNWIRNLEQEGRNKYSFDLASIPRQPKASTCPRWRAGLLRGRTAADSECTVFLGFFLGLHYKEFVG